MTVTDLTERIIETPDGRVLAVQESGDPAGRPVLVHMGTPNSRHLYGPNQADAAARGLRLICYDRPGYGGPPPPPRRAHAPPPAPPPPHLPPPPTHPPPPPRPSAARP